MNANRTVRCILGVAVAGAAIGCGGKSSPPAPPPVVKVTRPVRQEVDNVAVFTGNLAAVNSVDLRARVRGFLKEVTFKDGQEVSKGQKLFVIEQAPYRAAVDQAEAELGRAKAAATQAQQVYERYKKSFDQKVATETELIDARAKRDETKAQVEAAKAALETAKINLGYTTITAPIAGRLSRRFVDVGNLVGDGQTTLLANLVQVDPVYVYFHISEKTLLSYMNRYGHTADEIKPGKESVPARLGLADEQGFPHEGLIDYADNTVDPTTGTIRLRGEFPNPHRELVAGLFARIRIELGKPESALLIPERALSRSQQGTYVYVVDENQTVRQQVVTIGQKVGSLRVVETGLKETDRVVVEGILRLRPGAKVTPQPFESASPATQPTTRSTTQPATAPSQGG